jgi:hypothetical protein
VHDRQKAFDSGLHAAYSPTTLFLSTTFVGLCRPYWFALQTRVLVMNRVSSACAFACLLVLCVFTEAQQLPGRSLSRVIPMSGEISNADGTPCSGIVGVMFSAYSDSQGGAALWSEIQNATCDATGHYTVLLGSQHLEGVPDDLFTSSQTRWLGVQVESESEQPRVRLQEILQKISAISTSRPPLKTVTASIAPPVSTALSAAIDAPVAVPDILIVLSRPQRPSRPMPPPSPFSSTGDLGNARSGHAAVLLGNGTVLVMGGSDGKTFLASAEIYDPTAGTFSATGSMQTGRSWPVAASLLQDGNVLIAGGSSFTGPTNAAEIYASGVFTATGSLPAARSGHTLTLLNNGTVLVAGGTSDSSALLYHADSGTFSSTGTMTLPVSLHVAALLPSGRVLITGGDTSGGGLATTAQLYDPVSSTFASSGALAAGREFATATLLPNGTVLVAGGRACCNPNFYVTSAAEIYNPATGQFTPTGSLATARTQHTATLLGNGKVLVVAGDSPSGTLSSAELYDPATGQFTPAGNLSFARRFHSATLLPSGKVLIVGGQNTAGYLNTTEIYDPAVAAAASVVPGATSITLQR